jgi:5-formyltetrahydrofolate cyclo-ligase
MPETKLYISADARAVCRGELRKQGIEHRLALSTDVCAVLSARVCEHLKDHFPQLAGMRVGFCWPVKNEPDLRPLVLSWIASRQAGFAALLPVVLGIGSTLAFREWVPGTPLVADRYGIPTPREGAFQVPEALLLPVNAFDAAGYRIGYGGGFFDRTLAALDPTPLSIGVGFELARVDSIHPEPHDVRLDAMVSEAGVFRNPQS